MAEANGSTVSVCVHGHSVDSPLDPWCQAVLRVPGAALPSASRPAYARDLTSNPSFGRENKPSREFVSRVDFGYILHFKIPVTPKRSKQ